MTQLMNSPPTSKEEAAAQNRARLGWLRLRNQLSKIGPSDLARLLLVTLAITALVWLIVVSWPALVPFVVGGFIAYLLFPIVNSLDQILPRPIAALFSLAAFFALVFVILSVLAPALAEQGVRLYTNLLTPEKIAATRQELIDYLQAQPEPLRSIMRGYLEQVGQNIQTRVDAFFGQLAASNVNALLRVFNTVGTVFGLLVLPFWVLTVITSQRKGVNALRSLLPDWMEPDFWAVIRIFDRTLNAFLRGQLKLAIAAGIGFYMGLALLERFTPIQIDYPIVAGIFAGVLQLIPQVGPVIAVLLLFLFSLQGGFQYTLALVGVYLAVQFIINQLIGSRVSRRIVDLNPAVLVLFITALSQFGLIWVLLAAPVLSIVRDLFRYTYGRFGDPPRPAGVLPGEVVPPQPLAAQSAVSNQPNVSSRRQPIR